MHYIGLQARPRGVSPRGARKPPGGPSESYKDRT